MSRGYLIENDLQELFVPDGVPVVADDAAVIGASTAVERQAADREKQLPVRAHDRQRATV